MRLEKIKKSDIDPSPWTIRTTSDEKALELLSDSIAAVGLIQPPVVRPNPEKKGRYLITDGNRRWKCYEDDAIIDCLVLEQSEFQAKLTGLIENYIRENLSENDHERVITEIYYEGVKNKAWTNFSEMQRATGIPRETINSHVNAYNDRKKLNLVDQPNVSTTDMIESRPLADQPELRKKLLQQRANGELKKEGHIVHKRAKLLAGQQKTTNTTKLDQYFTSTATVSPATTTQPIQIATIIKEPEKTQTPSQPTTPSPPEKPPETTPLKMITDNIQEEDQNKPCITAQPPVTSSFEPLQKYTSQDPPPKDIPTLFYEQSHKYFSLLKIILPRDITCIESPYERKELISWLKEIEDRIDELLKITDGKSYFPRQFYKGLR